MATIFLAAGALTLVAIAAAIIYGLMRAERRGEVASFLLEVSAKEGEAGKPSVSRLQMLIWNFVIAFAFLYVLASVGFEDGMTVVALEREDGGTTTLTRIAAALDALFSVEILALLGISNGTYLLGKMTRQADAQPAAGDAAAGDPATPGPGPVG